MKRVVAVNLVASIYGRAVVVALSFAVALVVSFGVARNVHAETTPSAQSVLESLPADSDLVSGEQLLNLIGKLKAAIVPQKFGCGWKDGEGISGERMNLFAYKITGTVPGLGTFEARVYTFEMSVGDTLWYLDIFPDLGQKNAYVLNKQFAHGVVLDKFLEWLKTYSPNVSAFVSEGKGDCRPLEQPATPSEPEELPKDHRSI